MSLNPYILPPSIFNFCKARKSSSKENAVEGNMNHQSQALNPQTHKYLILKLEW